MDFLPSEILGKIFTYLEFSDAVRFEPLSKACGSALRQSAVYFDDIPTDEFTLEISTNICNEFIFEICNYGTVAMFTVHFNGQLENMMGGLLNPLPDSECDQLTLLKSVFRWIKWNVETIRSKWGPKSDSYFHFAEIKLGDYELFYIPEKAVNRLVEAILSEGITAERLLMGDDCSANIELECYFANILHQNNVAREIMVQVCCAVPSRELILLAQEWTDSVSIQTDRCIDNPIRDLVGRLKKQWISMKENDGKKDRKRPWSLTIIMDLQHSGRYTDQALQGISTTYSDETFSVTFDSEPTKHDKKDYYHAQIKAY